MVLVYNLPSFQNFDTPEKRLIQDALANDLEDLEIAGKLNIMYQQSSMRPPSLVNDVRPPDIYKNHSVQYSSLVQREQDLSSKMIRKFQREMDHLIKHEEQVRAKRNDSELKLEQIINKDREIERQKQLQQQRIAQMKHEKEQQSITAQRQQQEQFQHSLQQERLKSKQELYQLEAVQQEKDFNLKLHYIKQKLKQQEFDKQQHNVDSSKKLMSCFRTSRITCPLRNTSTTKARCRKNRQIYLNNFQQRKQENVSNSIRRKEQHMSEVRQNYQLQMQNIQDFLRNKIARYNWKIQNQVQPTKQQQREELHNKSMQNSYHISQVLQANSQIKRQRLQKYRDKINYLQQRVDLIEQRKELNLLEQSNIEQQRDSYRQNARAKSENYYRNKSQNIVSKLQMKDEQFYNMMELHREYENEKRKGALQQWDQKQYQVQMADRAKQEYLKGLSQRIQDKDQRVIQQIQHKSQIYNDRLKLIDDMQKQKRSLISNIYSSNLPQYSSNDIVNDSKMVNESKNWSSFQPTQ